MMRAEKLDGSGTNILPSWRDEMIESTILNGAANMIKPGKNRDEDFQDKFWIRTFRADGVQMNRLICPNCGGNVFFRTSIRAAPQQKQHYKLTMMCSWMDEEDLLV